MESPPHAHLKHLSLRFLRAQGCAAAATEVRCPISRYRVDAAGWSDGVMRRRGERRVPATIVIECKGTRADFLRDREEAALLLERRARLERIARSIEEHRIRKLEPHLRCGGTSLFAELEQWDYAGSRLRSYQRVMDALRAIERDLHGRTKFCTLARYRLADRLYLAAVPGVVRTGELPAGWGLLELREESLAESIPAPALGCRDDRRVRLLRNIAVAAGRRAGDGR